jgi:nitrite reductase (NADH) small subunit
MTDLASHATTRKTWTRTCRLDQLTPDRGVAAMVGGRQVALFRLSTSGEVLAVDNRDPFSGAQVLSRGIVGEAEGVPKVASPVYKQAFDLRTGHCLDDPDTRIEVHTTRLVDGWVEVDTS